MPLPPGRPTTPLTAQEVKEIGQVNDIIVRLMVKDELDHGMHSIVPEGRDALKSWLAPLLETKEWHLVDKVIDEIIDMKKFGDEEARKAGLAQTPEDIAREERMMNRLTERGALPRPSEAEQAEMAARKQAADVLFRAQHGDANAVIDGIRNRQPAASVNDAHLSRPAVGNVEPHAGMTAIKGAGLGVAGVGLAMLSHANKGIGAMVNAGEEAVLPGSTTVHHDICQAVGTEAGGILGTLASAAAGAVTFTALGGPVDPLAYAGATGAGMGTYSVTQPVIKNVTQAACDAILPSSVKEAASNAMQALDSALSFGGSNHVTQNTHREVSADISKGAAI